MNNSYELFPLKVGSYQVCVLHASIIFKKVFLRRKFSELFLIAELFYCFFLLSVFVVNKTISRKMNARVYNYYFFFL
jgi:hypothetical protein